jgi:hypothetical protein
LLEKSLLSTEKVASMGALHGSKFHFHPVRQPQNLKRDVPQMSTITLLIIEPQEKSREEHDQPNPC